MSTKLGALSGGILLMLIGCAAPCAAGAMESDAAGRGGDCRDFDVPLTVAGQPATMHGSLCLPPGEGRPTNTVMVLLHGSTYTRLYWDFPHRPNRYSFRVGMNRAGYATAAVDKLGVGGSSRLPSTAATIEAQVAGIHAVVQALRAGQIGGKAFTKVIVGGHSSGSVVVILHAATHPGDADGVLLTGLTHRIDPVKVGELVATLYPAALDPAFMQAVPPYDAGYVTTMPGTRFDDFYAPGVAEAAVVAVDEATKGVFSFTEAAGGQQVLDDPTISQSIGVPVLIVLGALDAIFICSAAGLPCTDGDLRAQEAPFYSAGACLQTFVLPEAGHSFNLFPNARRAWRAVSRWADRFVGRGPGPVTPPPGACP